MLWHSLVDGTTRMIHRVEVGNEKVYLKKSFDGWRVVNPVFREDKINWKNLCTGGSYWNLVKLGLIFLLIFFLTWSYIRDTKICQEIDRDICKWCFNITASCMNAQPILPNYVSDWEDFDSEVIFDEET